MLVESFALTMDEHQVQGIDPFLNVLTQSRNFDPGP